MPTLYLIRGVSGAGKSSLAQEMKKQELHDSKFAVTYLEEKRPMLDVLTKADSRLVQIARSQITV